MKTFERKIVVVSTGVLKGLPRRRGRLFPVQGTSSIGKALVSEGSQSDTWLATTSEAAANLLNEASRLTGRTRRNRGSLVLLEPPTLATLASASNLFKAVSWVTATRNWLPLDELLAVLETPDPREFIIGGVVDATTETLYVYRGDFRQFAVPLSIFQPSGTGVTIDPSDFEPIDNGHAIRFGKYEAATDSIFYECDPEYRRRYRKKLQAEDRTFGASLRRLRILRGMKQDDFAPLASKTIARIERNEVEKPHGLTLKRLADRLGVAVDEIETY